MSSFRPKDRSRFRPVIDDCERRELLSTLALLPSRPAAGIAALNVAPPANSFGLTLESAPSQVLKGGYSKGYYPAGSDKVVFFAVDFGGTLSKANAQKAFDYGKNLVVSRGTTLSNTSAAGRDRTTSSQNFLIGWYNSTRKETGWLAGTYGGSRTWTTPGYVPPWYRPWERSTPPEIHTAYKVRYMTNAMNSTSTVEGAASAWWQTRGYRVDLKLDPVNSAGDLVATFTPPR